MASTTTIDRNLTVTAKKLGVSLASLLKANPQLRNPNLIRAGTQLRVPSRRKVSARESAQQLARVFAQPSSGSVSAVPAATIGAPDRQIGTAPSTAQAVPDFQFDPQLAPSAATPGGREIRHRPAAGGQAATDTLDPRLAARSRLAGVTTPRPTGTPPAFLQAVDRFEGEIPTPGPGTTMTPGATAQHLLAGAARFLYGNLQTFAGQGPPDVAAGAARLQGATREALERPGYIRPFALADEKAPNTLRSASVDDDPIVMTELIRNADGTVTRKPLTRSQMEERLSTPQDVVLSQSINGRTYNLTASDIAYGARLTGQALFEFRKQEDPSLRPSLVSNVSAYNLLGMGETLTGTPVSSVEDMMTKLGYTLVGDFWVVNDPFSSPRVFESPSLSRERRRGGGGGRVGRGPSGFGRSPSNLYNWHIRITV